MLFQKQLCINLTILLKMPVSDKTSVAPELVEKCENALKTFRSLQYVGYNDLLTPIDEEYVVQNYGDEYANAQFLRRQKRRERQNKHDKDSDEDNSSEEEEEGYSDSDSDEYCPLMGSGGRRKKIKRKDMDTLHPTTYIGRTKRLYDGV